MLYSNSFADRRKHAKKVYKNEIYHLDLFRSVGHFHSIKKGPHFSGVFFYKKLNKGEKNERGSKK